MTSLRTRLTDARRRLRRRVPAAWVPARWTRRPAGPRPARLCVFVMLARDGRLLPHSIDHARAWARAGYEVVVVVVVDALDRPVDLGALDFAGGVLLRRNIGYDFGAWAAAIGRLRRRIAGCELLAIANDSLLGPSAMFGAMLDRAAASEADLVGLTRSEELAPHYQSFVVFFRRGALRSPAFRRFWRSVRSGDRDEVIRRHELTLQAHFTAAGLATEALFVSADTTDKNPTLRYWRKLLVLGFPYLKIMLLRDNPYGVSLDDWLEEAARHGFDAARLRRQVGELKNADGRPWAV